MNELDELRQKLIDLRAQENGATKEDLNNLYKAVGREQDKVAKAVASAKTTEERRTASAQERKIAKLFRDIRTEYAVVVAREREKEREGEGEGEGDRNDGDDDDDDGDGDGDDD